MKRDKSLFQVLDGFGGLSFPYIYAKRKKKHKTRILGVHLSSKRRIKSDKFIFLNLNSFIQKIGRPPKVEIGLSERVEQ
jgi:hypothetical protein